MLDYPSASWKHMFLTQPVLREVKTWNFFSYGNNTLRFTCNPYLEDHNTAFQKVEDVEGVKMGQVPITLNHSANTRPPKNWWEWPWIEIVLVEESER